MTDNHKKGQNFTNNDNTLCLAGMWKKLFLKNAYISVYV